MMHRRPWNLPAWLVVFIATERQRGNLVFSICAVLCLLIVAAACALAGDAVAAATAADWAANPQAAAGAADAGVRAAAEAGGWSWGELAAGGGAVLLFLSRFVPGWGGVVADLAWRFFADRRARQADQAQQAAAHAVSIVHAVAPAALQTALNRLPADRATAVRSLIAKV